MSIPSKSHRIVKTPSGTINSRAPDGDDGSAAIPLIWATIPNFLNQVATTDFDKNLRSLYLTEPGTPTATITLVEVAGTLAGAGLSLSGGQTLTHDDLTQGTATLRARAVRNGFTVESNDFICEFVAPALTDTLAPTIPTGLTLTATHNSVTGTWDASSDPKEPTVGATGMKDYIPKRGSTDLSAVSSSPGVSLQLTGSDVGTFSPAGSNIQTGANWSVTSAGNQIFGTSDQFRFVSVQVTGDMTIIAKLASFSSAFSQFSEAGLMVRKSLDADSQYAHMTAFSTDARGVKLEYRLTTGGSASGLTATANIAKPLWLKLARVGSNVTGYYSTNGNEWVQQGSTISLPMTDPVYVGLAVCSVSPGNQVTASFEQVNLQNLAQPTFTDTGLTANTSYSYTVRGRDLAGTPNVSSQGSAVSITTSPAPSADHLFPRLSLIAGGDVSYAPAWQTVASDYHAVLLYGGNEGWSTTHGRTKESVVTGIKGASTIGTKVLQYQNPIEQNPSAPQLAGWFAKCVANNWWLYTNGSSGTKVPSSFNASWWLANFYPGMPVDSGTGLRPYQYAAKYCYDRFIAGTGPGPAGDACPSIDGIFLDNVFWKPRVNGDYNRDGVTDDQNNSTIKLNFRTGLSDFFTYFATLAPTKLLTGNGDFGSSGSSDPAAVSPLNNLLDGGMFEHSIGQSFSSETWGGFSTMMTRYKMGIDCLKGPKIIFFDLHLGMNTTESLTNAHYQTIRYAMASCLQNNGYFGMSRDSSAHRGGTIAQILTCEEFDNAGAGVGYLGAESEDPRTTARWAKGSLGVWAREFPGGIAIANPKGNGTQSITTSDLGGSGVFRRINGSQPYNTGASVTSSITLQDRDGIILLRN